VLYFCFVFLRLVYHMLPVSLDCPFCIALSVFSNVFTYHANILYVNNGLFLIAMTIVYCLYNVINN